MAKCVLLTGGIASGKSTVSHYFLQEYGIQTVDTDVIARTLTQPTTPLGVATLKVLKEHFPAHINDELILNRETLRHFIFDKPDAKKQLELILHPLIYKETLNAISLINDVYCLAAVPLLYPGSKYLKLTDEIITVESSPEMQIERLMKRDNMTQTLAKSIIDSQPSKEMRMSIANHLINTACDYENIYRQCAVLHNILHIQFSHTH